MTISGVQEGCILARSPSENKHKIILTDEDKYIIITNFDYWNNDIREYFDPTAGHIGKPRRIFAQDKMDAAEAVTPELLMDVLQMDGVFCSSTIW